MNDAEFTILLRQKVKEEGGIVRFSLNHDISMGYLTNVLYCGQKPGPKITLAVGMKKIFVYVPVK